METVYCCRKCRRPLFRGVNLVAEEIHDKTSYAFKQGKVEPCTSFFLKEPEGWMSLSEQEGKLVCPGCETRFGSYVWSGAQCSCGFWVVPAIQIPKSKVDPRLIKI